MSELNDPNYWDNALARYEAMAAPFTSLFAEVSLALIDIGHETRVLDVACGTGALARAASSRGARVVAIDFAPAMVNRVRALGDPKIEAHVMNGEALDLPDESFDITASIFGVMLFPNWRAGLREMARVTRAGGLGVLATWKEPDGAAINLLLADVRRFLFPGAPLPPPPSGMAALRTPDSIVSEMAAAGFTDIVVKHVTHDFGLRLSVLDDAEHFFTMLPLWTELETAQQDAVIAEIRRRAASKQTNGVLSIPSTALIAVAQRP